MKPGRKRGGGGRPPKFKEPRRPVTVTLPERTLELLAAVDKDRARAIVKAVDATVGADHVASHPVRLAPVEPGWAVIVVGPSTQLQKIPWLKLVEITPSQYLLAMPTGTPLDSIEVTIMDLIENLGSGNNYERKLLTDLRDQLAHLRRTRKMHKLEVILVSV